MTYGYLSNFEIKIWRIKEQNMKHKAKFERVTVQIFKSGIRLFLRDRKFEKLNLRWKEYCSIILKDDYFSWN